MDKLFEETLFQYKLTVPQLFQGRLTKRKSVEHIQISSAVCFPYNWDLISPDFCGTNSVGIFSSSFAIGAFFAIQIPFESAADTKEDFANNVLLHFAPILALFGEQVEKQYMGQSMSWVEDIIANARLGTLNAIVGAIRIGRAHWMKASIGRAREEKGVAEAELMLSTSSDVCELWNGEHV